MGARTGDHFIVDRTSVKKIDLYSIFYGLVDTNNELTLAQHVVKNIPVYVSLVWELVHIEYLF